MTATAAPEPNPPPVGLQGAGIWFDTGPGRVTIVEALDLSVPTGTFHCFAGRSGSGKTSVLRVLGGFTDPAAGRVLWDGQGITELHPDARARRRRGWMGYVNQDASLIDGFSCLENVLMPSVPDRRVDNDGPRGLLLLEQLGLSDRRDHRAELLSGGERQRATLARALLLRPAVLLLDEPTASLDRGTADAVVRLLTAAAADGTTVIAASHDPHVIEAAVTTTHLE